MPFELKAGQGALHRVADKQGNARRPDYTGELNIDGVTYRLAGWIKAGKTSKWLSLTAELPRAALLGPDPPAAARRPPATGHTAPALR